MTLKLLPTVTQVRHSISSTLFGAIPPKVSPLFLWPEWNLSLLRFTITETTDRKHLARHLAHTDTLVPCEPVLQKRPVSVGELSLQPRLTMEMPSAAPTELAWLRPSEREIHQRLCSPSNPLATEGTYNTTAEIQNYPLRILHWISYLLDTTN